MRKRIHKTALSAGSLLISAMLITSLSFIPQRQSDAYDLSDGVYYAYDFDELVGAPISWDITSFNQQSSVFASQGSLQVNNVSKAYANGVYPDDATEIKLPALMSENYVLEFDMTRIESANNASISIKYAIQKDGAGYEFRVPMYQQDHGAPYWYTQNTAMEYRKVLAGGSVTENIDNYRFYALNFFQSEFFREQTYRFTFFRYEGTNRLLIDGREYLHFTDNNKIYVDGEIGEDGRYEEGDLILRFNRQIRANIDNLIVKTPQEYLACCVRNLGDVSKWSDKTLIDNAPTVKELYDLFNKTLSAKQKADCVEYATVCELWDRYAEIVAPTITLDWSVGESIPVGSEIHLEAMATAVDYQGRSLAVEVQVLFGDKYLFIKDGYAAFNEKGNYTVRFIAYDRNGFSSVMNKTLVVA